MPGQFWCVYGQTKVEPGENIDDPTPNTAGVLGEVAQLPYTVPPGKILILIASAVEGLKSPVSALVPWLGNYPPGCVTDVQKTDYRRSHQTVTVQCIGGSHELLGQRFPISAGTVVHMRLTNAMPAYSGAPANTMAWGYRGVLIDDTEDILDWLD